ncbi:nucleoside 2-deoxyribosyltransferase, partial [Carnobacterium sp.]|uniref:nucleoside 2-deoxyribosyltransferase n=1 Tax=Carnobacterium sp. TaxID=48221 RepID=UPI0028AD0281
MTKKAYFASPLFSEMELMYNDYLVKEIKQKFPALDLYVPQEQTEINDKNAYADSIMIAKMDTDQLLSCDFMIAVLDGAAIDVGVATEIGVAYQAGIPIVGLYTDSRQQGATNQKKLEALQEIAESQFSYINLYT